MGAAVAKAEAAPVNPGGRPTKLKPEVQRALVGAIRKGAPVKLAAEAIGLSEQTVMEWIRRGRGEDLRRSDTEPYAKFAADVAKAQPALRMHALTTVNRVVKGQKCRGCAGYGTRTIETDKGERDVKCPPCGGTGWQIRPDGKLAMTVLERQVSEFARRDRVTHEHSHAVRVTGSVTVEHTTTGAASALVALAGGQIAALLGAPPALEVGEADVVDAEVVGEDATTGSSS